MALLLLFAYVAGPDIYRRPTKPIAITGAIGVTPIGTTSTRTDQNTGQAQEKIIANASPEYLTALSG
jgi:hypothetical protein